MGKEYQIFITDDDNIVEFKGRLDLISRFTQTHRSSVTTVPIEDGYVISDHVQIEPITLRLDAIVSNLYIPIGATQSSSVSSIKQGRPESVFNELVGMKDDRKLLAVHSMLGAYSQMVITDLSATEDDKTGTALYVSISMQEIKIARSQEFKRFVQIDQERVVKRADIVDYSSTLASPQAPVVHTPLPLAPFASFPTVGYYY